jgi:hypothetical protein
MRLRFRSQQNPSLGSFTPTAAWSLIDQHCSGLLVTSVSAAFKSLSTALNCIAGKYDTVSEYERCYFEGPKEV